MIKYKINNNIYEKGKINRINYHKDIIDFIKNDDDFFYSENDFDFSFDTDSKILTYIASFNYRSFCDKYQQDYILKKKKYNPKTINYKNYQKYKEKYKNTDYYYFVKPKDGSAGENIILTKDPYSLIENDNNLIAQREIKSLLINNKKWDLRLYIVQQILDNKLNTYLFNDGLIRISPYDYKTGDLQSNLTNISQINDDINIINKCNMKFSDYEYYDIILKKIKKVLKDIHNHLNKFLDIDSEYLSEFKLFGFDFIVSEDFNIYLLEINKIPNYISKKNSVEIKELKKKLYKSISQKFIKDVFLDIHDRNDNFIKIN